jgi:NACalpha-BTF3-like transcription factor
LLRSEYKLTETDVRMLTDMLPEELMNDFRAEVLALRDRMNRYKVNNPKSYVVTSLKNFIIQHTPEAKETKEDNRVEEKKTVNHKTISEEDKSRWMAFMELLQGSVSPVEFSTWLSSLEFVSLNGEEVTLSVPAAYVATYIDEKLSAPFKQALNAVYGEDVKLLYEVRK